MLALNFAKKEKRTINLNFLYFLFSRKKKTSRHRYSYRAKLDFS